MFPLKLISTFPVGTTRHWQFPKIENRQYHTCKYYTFKLLHSPSRWRKSNTLCASPLHQLQLLNSRDFFREFETISVKFTVNNDETLNVWIMNVYVMWILSAEMSLPTFRTNLNSVHSSEAWKVSSATAVKTSDLTIFRHSFCSEMYPSG